jgi:hypothetical protein
VIVWLQKVVAIKGAILFQTNDLLFQPGHLWRIRRYGEMAKARETSLPAGDPEANFCRPWRIILNRYQMSSDIITGWWCNNYLEKYDFVNGKDDIPYMKWKIKKFETTNQIRFFGVRRYSNQHSPFQPF